MSKERSRRRAVREAEAARARRAGQRRHERHQRRKELRRMVRLPDRRTGRLFARRTRGQRGVIGIGVSMALLLVWLYGGPLANKIALSLLIAAATPVLVVLTLDRRI